MQEAASSVMITEKKERQITKIIYTGDIFK